MKIADFFGLVSFKADTKVVDDALLKMEGRLERFVNKWNGKTIQVGARLNSKSLDKSVTEAFANLSKRRTLKLNATIDKIKLDKSIIGNAIKAANLKLSNIKVSGKTAAINLDNFKINQGALKNSLLTAISNIEKQIQINLNVNARTGRVTGGNVTNNNSTSSSRRSLLNGKLGFGLGTGIGMIAGGPVAGAAGAIYGFQQWNNANNEMIGIRNTLRAVSDSPAEGDAKEKFLKALATEMGTDYKAMARPASLMYAAAQNTPLKGEKTDKLIEAMTAYSTTLNLSPEAIEGSFRAVHQMMSKGRVQSEELKSQLSEWMAGAEQLMAEGWTGTKDPKGLTKLLADMKAGKVDSPTALEKLTPLLKAAAERNDALSIAKNSPRAQQNRFRNQLEFFSQEFGEAGGNKGSSRIFESLNKAIAKLRENVGPLAKAFNYLADVFSRIIGTATTFIDVGSKIFDRLTMAEKATGAFGAALFVLSKNPVFAAFTGLYYVLDDIATYLRGGDSLLGRFVEQFSSMGQGINPFKDILGDVRNLFNDVLNIVKDVGSALVKISETDIFKDVLKASYENMMNSFKKLHEFLAGMHQFLSGETIGERAGGLGKMGQALVMGVAEPLANTASSLTRVPGRAIGGAIGSEFNYKPVIDPHLSTQENARNYLADMRMRGNKVVNGPTPSMTISMPINITTNSPQEFENYFLNSFNDVLRRSQDNFVERPD